MADETHLAVLKQGARMPGTRDGPRTRAHRLT